MATNDYEIVNLALVRLGATRITSLSDGSRNANEANAIYTLIRDEVMRSHPWKFATRRASLDEHDPNVLTVTGLTQADPCVLTYTGTDPTDGDEYLFESVGGMTQLNDNVYVVDGVNAGANTFKLLDTDSTAYGAWTAGGTATEQIPHTSEFSYIYDLPSNCLRVIAINDNFEAIFEVDPTGLLCNDEFAEIIYIKQVTDVTQFDTTFVDAFAWKLGAELAVVVTGSMKKLEACMKMYSMTIANAKMFDASEKKEDYPAFSRYKNARR